MRAEGVPPTSVFFRVIPCANARLRESTAGGEVAGWQNGSPEGMLRLHDPVDTSGPLATERADERKERSLSKGACRVVAAA